MPQSEALIFFALLIASGVSVVAAGICADLKLKHTSEALGAVAFVAMIIFIIGIIGFRTHSNKHEPVVNGIAVSPTPTSSSK